MKYFCCDKLRRIALKKSNLNGIDFLEVLDRDTTPPAKRQRILYLHFLNKKHLANLTKDNVQILGGDRIRDVVVLEVKKKAGMPANIRIVEVDKPGDFSRYTLRLVRDVQNPEPPIGFDPILSNINFSFKVECPTDFDCKKKRICPIESPPQPDINYLAKDYASFRRLMLDRIAVLMPQWKERSPADIGVALVELLAYIGDYLSYQQDAVATEAYLDTARKRVSVRRHARLVDYYMHDGCNARAWVQVQVSAKNVLLEKGTQLLTRVSGQPARIPPVSQAYDQALQQRPEVFETLHKAKLFSEHKELHFYTWGDQQCCLPKGTTKATLKGPYPNLKNGDVLIFEEILGPLTGKSEDADPNRRHPLRLTKVIFTDANGDPLIDPLNNQEITEIEWADEDCLPFPFCISSVTDKEHGQEYEENISVARGNIVLTDHGLTVEDERLDSVPVPKLFKVPVLSDDWCKERARETIPSRFYPKLKEQPLTHGATVLITQIVDGQKSTKRLPFDPDASASAAFRWKMKDVIPSITLNNEAWEPKRDLLDSEPDKKEFVVEIENDGTAFLRFGDDKYGKRPEPETEFTATYRIGNGTAGNVGAESIAHIVSSESAIIGVRNPLSAQGGLEPETIEEAKQKAPFAFRTQERAVTEEDYADVAERNSSVQKAAATFRWTGSWHTVFLTIDWEKGLLMDETFKKEVRQHLERFRMAGYDLEVDGPRFVPLEIEMDICVKPDYFRSEVKKALIDVFSNQILPDGRRGVFHPDNFTFGQTVYLSRLYAAAQAVPGVSSAHIMKFIRRHMPDDPKPLAEGKIILGRLEIARLDNDPNFPEHGVFRLNMKGGK